MRRSAALGVAILFAIALPRCSMVVGAEFDVKLRGADGGATPSQTCTAPRADCNGLAADGCEVDLASDPDHCGTCTTVCGEGKVCASSACADGCPTKLKACGRACVDVQTSGDHCGRCDNKCTGNAFCTNGTCEQCPSTPCRLKLPQCGCPSGQACYRDGETATRCLPAGNTAEAATCTDDASCQPGHVCVTLFETTVKVCKRVCDTDQDCSGPGSHCRVAVGSLKLCSIGCEPATNAKCPSGTGCGLQMEPVGGQRYTECGAIGPRQQNAPCSATDRCAPGFNCAQDTGGTICAHYCRSGVAGDCPPQTSCQIADFSDKIGATVYGACFP